MNNQEIAILAKWMDEELQANSHKGEWREFNDPNRILVELEWHKAKLLIAIRNGEREKIKEYIADCCNELLFMANALDLL